MKLTTAKYYIPSLRCIQAVEYENGEPLDIPDDKRTPFKTRNGRTVLDGGGVKPDKIIDRDGSSKLLKQLQRSNIIFDYATNYCANKQSVGELMNLRFNDFTEFVAFVEERNFNYDSKTEKLLKDLEEQAAEDGFDLKEGIEALKTSIVDTKRAELLEYQEAIEDIIEKEIAGRYFYQEGTVKIGLRNDLEIEEAIDLLKNTNEYKKILSNS